MGWRMGVDVDYFQDPKTLDLKAALDDLNADIYPPRLWAWATKYRKAGKLDSARQVELACEWRGKSGVLATALIAAELITPEFEIASWMKYIGKDLANYEAKKARQAEKYGAKVREQHDLDPRPTPPEHLASGKVGLLVDILQRKHCPNAIATLRKWADSWAAKKGFQEAEKILNNMPEGMDIIEIRDKYFSAESDEKDWKEIVKEREEERVRNGR